MNEPEKNQANIQQSEVQSYEKSQRSSRLQNEQIHSHLYSVKSCLCLLQTMGNYFQMQSQACSTSGEDHSKSSHARKLGKNL